MADESRITAIDVLRGLVVLLLVPDMQGGFSFYEMARLHPDSKVWSALAGQFTHVPWAGAALWDLVMPVFVFVVGVSLALSQERREARGQDDQLLVARALLRTLTLAVLGLQLGVTRSTLAVEAVPYLLLATGLPWSRWARRWWGPPSRWRDVVLELVLPAIVVGSVALWQATHIERLEGYDFNQILSQLGCAFLLTFVLRGKGIRRPIVHAVLVLVLWSAAGVLHAMLAGTAPGPAGPWGDAHTMAGEFDRWLFGALPRTVPYSVEAHRFYTLEFIPLVPNMLVGVAVGRALYRASPRAQLAWPLIGMAIAGFAIAAVLTLAGIPLVKSLWTPSWSVFSAACCALALALALWAFENPVGHRWAQPLAVLGANTVLLYVVAFVDRWRIVLYAERLIGAPLTASELRPLLQSLVVLATLWVFAYALERARIRVSL